MSDTFNTILFSSIGLTTAGVAGAGLDGILLEVEQRRGSLAGHGLHCMDVTRKLFKQDHLDILVYVCC